MDQIFHSKLLVITRDLESHAWERGWDGFLDPWCSHVEGQTSHRIRMYAIYGNIYHQYTPNVSINLPYIRIRHGIEEEREAHDFP